jgi:hypothetical protein
MEFDKGVEGGEERGIFNGTRWPQPEGFYTFRLRERKEGPIPVFISSKIYTPEHDANTT